MRTMPSKNLLLLLLTTLVILTSGCSFNHPVARDYQAYIDNDKYPRTLPKSNVESSYVIDQETQNHRYEFRAASVGYAHAWIVEFGKILDLTLNADYVQSAFGKLDRASANSTDGYLLAFTLQSYKFENYQAYVTMDVTVNKAGMQIFDKRYSATGVNQAGKMWSAGAFGMKNATLQSTKFAIDDILSEMIDDLNNL